MRELRDRKEVAKLAEESKVDFQFKVPPPKRSRNTTVKKMSLIIDTSTRKSPRSALPVLGKNNAPKKLPSRSGPWGHPLSVGEDLTNTTDQHEDQLMALPRIYVRAPPSCCRLGDCLAYYDTVGVYMKALAHATLIKEYSVEQQSAKYVSQMQGKPGTLQNKQVCVCSSSSSSFPTLGLFALRVFQAGDIVTMYGGVQRDALTVLNEKQKHITHARRIAASEHVYDGRPYSEMFCRDEDELEHEKNVDFSKKKHFLPSFWNTAVINTVMTGGIGYMMNTAADASLFNVKPITIQLTRNGVFKEVAFIATRQIEVGEELLSPYNNNDHEYLE